MARRNKNYIWKWWSMHVDLRISWMQHRKLQTSKAVPGTKAGTSQLVGVFKKGRQWDIGEAARKLEQIWFYKWALSRQPKLPITNGARRKAAEKHFRLTWTAGKCWGLQLKTLCLTLTGPSTEQIQGGKLWKLCAYMQTRVWKKCRNTLVKHQNV